MEVKFSGELGESICGNGRWYQHLRNGYMAQKYRRSGNFLRNQEIYSSQYVEMGNDTSQKRFHRYRHSFTHICSINLSDEKKCVFGSGSFGREEYNTDIGINECMHEVH